MSCRLILVSHALTQWNIEGRIQGHTDVPLN
ncbi:MAG: histidine phosphatase family protein, partial [Desulfobacula sp.]|nr:histidine phosphatase family protein [Desulfobacula sp.]